MSQPRRDLAAGYLTTIKSIMDESIRTDYIMPTWLPLLPAILSLVIAFISMAMFLLAPIVQTMTVEFAEKPSSEMEMAVSMAVLGLMLSFVIFALAIIAIIIGVYVMYKWIKRRNEHFSRSHRLYENVILFLEAMGMGDPEIPAMKNMLQEMRYRETQKNPIVWIVLTYLTGGIIGFYVYHFLTRDFYEHERREQAIHEHLRNLLARYNLPLTTTGYSAVPDRNTVIYIVLSLITLGIFLLYWYYVLAKDPNEHFKQHSQVEADLYNTLYKLYTGGA